MITDSVSSLRQRMIEDMNARKLRSSMMLDPYGGSLSPDSLSAR
jgi:hypothetical protein